MEIKHGKFTRTISFRPAFDKRNTNAGKNYGIGSVELKFILKDDKKQAMQFMMISGWNLQHIRREREGNVPTSVYPLAADIGYHSPVMVEHVTPMDDCSITGGKCWYDGSTLGAEPIMERFLAEGEDAVWEELENHHASRFGEAT